MALQVHPLITVVVSGEGGCSSVDSGFVSRGYKRPPKEGCSVVAQLVAERQERSQQQTIISFPDDVKKKVKG